ncbi:MAG TPA: helix-turn-helix domain-containing protein [Acidimicrobiales bacterium]
MKRTRAFSRTTEEVARLLGTRVRLGRTERRWSAQELADRIGVTRVTVNKIERGDPTVGLGVAIEAAAMVGAPLFTDDDARLRLELSRDDDRLALLPRRVRKASTVDDDF